MKDLTERSDKLATADCCTVWAASKQTVSQRWKRDCVRSERRKVDKKKQTYMKTEARKLYSRDFWLNISAKYHQNRSLQFWAIPFRSWCIFWDTVYASILVESLVKSYILLLPRAYSKLPDNSSHLCRCNFINRMLYENSRWYCSVFLLTLWRSLVCNFWHPGTLTLSFERQGAQISKITNNGLTRSSTGRFIAVPIIMATVGVKG